MERKKSKTTKKKESRAKVWWKNYCKKHNLDRKDVRYCSCIFVINIVWLGLLLRSANFAFASHIASEVHIGCLEDKENSTIQYCRCISDKVEKKMEKKIYTALLLLAKGKLKNTLINIYRDSKKSCDYLLKN